MVHILCSTPLSRVGIVNVHTDLYRTFVAVSSVTVAAMSPELIIGTVDPAVPFPRVNFIDAIFAYVVSCPSTFPAAVTVVLLPEAIPEISISSHLHIAGLNGSGVGVGDAVGVAVGAAQVFAPEGPVHGQFDGQSVLVLHESPQASGVVGVGVGVPVAVASQVPEVPQTGQAVVH